MRKYISILAVALVALFTTSCELESGTEPNPNRANDLLWRGTKAVFNGMSQHILTVACLNDTMRNAEYGKAPYEVYNPDITESEGIYTISYGHDTYRINTAGKKLEEGGEWTINVQYGPYLEPYKLGTVKGVVGEPTKFSIDFDDIYAHGASFHNALKSEVEYSYNASDECLDTILTNAEGYSVEDYNSTTPDYIIEFKATNPLVFYGGIIHSGEVDIIYKDNILHTEKGVKVSISNKITTFVSQN